MLWPRRYQGASLRKAALSALASLCIVLQIHVGLPLFSHDLWPFTDYTVYCRSHRVGDIIEIFGLEGITFSGNKVPVTHEDFHLIITYHRMRLLRLALAMNERPHALRRYLAGLFVVYNKTRQDPGQRLVRLDLITENSVLGRNSFGPPYRKTLSVYEPSR